MVLTDNAEQLVKVLADNTGERPTAIEAVDAPIELEPEEIVRLLADKEPVWTPREEWEALERRARREGTVLFLVDGYGELIGGARELAENPDLPTLTREVVDGLLAYDRACREGDKAAVEFLGLLDEHDARRRGLDGAAAAAECPVAGLEDYPDWREMSGRLSANGKALLAELGERAGEAGDTISRRLGRLADLLAVDDAVLDFNTRRREVVAWAAAEGTIPFYAEGHDDLVERARELAKLSGLPAWALAAAKEGRCSCGGMRRTEGGNRRASCHGGRSSGRPQEAGEPRPHGPPVRVHPAYRTGRLCQLVGALRGGGRTLARHA